MATHLSLRGRVAACLCVFAFALAAIAEVPFSQIPNIGPVSQWESPTRLAFLGRIDRLIAYRAAEVPVERDRTVYMAQSDQGSATGGGNSGDSIESPFLVRHMSDVRTLLSSQLISGTSVLFRQGDTFFADSNNNQQGITIPDAGNCSIGSYFDQASPSTAKPRLLAFRRESVEGWTFVSPGIYERNLQYSAYWVRGRLAESDPYRGYRLEPYVKQPNADAVLAMPRSFYMNPNGSLRINIGTEPSDDLATVELACGKGPGIQISFSPSIRLDNLIIEGWGTDQPESGNGAIRSSQSGLNTLLITNCEWGWTAYHGLLHATSLDGGIVTLINCQFGYHTNRDAVFFGGGDGAVCFALLGSNEFILDRCTTFGGGLRRAGVAGADSNVQGYPVYMHTNGLTPISLHIRRDCVFIPASSTRARYSDYGGCPQGIVTLAGTVASQPADPLDVRYYRSFIINETAEINGVQSGGAFKTVDINCRSKFIFRSGGGNQYLWGVGSNTYDGLSINRDIELNFPSDMTGYFALAESQLQHKHVVLHGRLRITGAGPTTPASFFSTEFHAGRLDNCSVISSIISNETSRLSPVWNYANRPSTPTQGGVNNTATFAMPPAPWSNTQSPVALASAPSYPMTQAGSLLIPASLAGQVPDGPAAVEYDILGRRRPIPSSIGPLEANPVMCVADFNIDGTLSFFDYLDFVDAYSSLNSAADFNESGDIDFFDYLDFVDAYSIGC